MERKKKHSSIVLLMYYIMIILFSSPPEEAPSIRTIGLKKEICYWNNKESLYGSP